jgi:pyruvate formate-lyase activating enzyme-like uncharacterized protein
MNNLIESFAVTTIFLVALAAIVLVFAFLIHKSCKRLLRANQNRLARKRLKKRGFIASSQSSMADARPVKSKNFSQTIIISSFNKEIDYSAFDKPVIECRNRLEAYIKRSARRHKSLSEKLSLTLVKSEIDSEAQPVIESSVSSDVLVEHEANPEFNSEFKSVSYMESLRLELEKAFDSAPEACSEHSPSLLARQAY